MKITLVTLFDDSLQEVGQITSSRMAEYAKRHGYGFVRHSALLNPSIHPSWNKLLAIKQVFQTEAPDWVLWIDADALILNLHYAVSNIINEQFHILFSSDFNGLCAGVI